MNMFTVVTAFCCLIFCVFLAIVYFSKKNVNNVETKIYKWIIICDFIMIIFHITALYTGYYVGKIPHMLLIYDLSSRFFGFFNFIWCGLLEVYTLLMISNNENDLIHTFVFKKNEKISKVFTSIILVAFLLGCALPFKFYFVNGVIAYTGLCLFYYIFLLLIFLFITIYYIIKYFKSIDSYWKLSPLIFFAIMQFLNFFANLFDGTINEVPLALTLTSYFMYHVIENPDIKLITELKLAKEQAERANNAKGDFLNSMSQEMITPLNKIVELSEEIADSNEINAIHNDTDKIILSSQNVLELVNGILDINRLEVGNIDVVENKYNPRNEFDSVVQNISVNIGQKPVKFIVEYAENLPERLYGDKEKIKRIISNLLSNSVKYTDSGYIKFNVSASIEREICNMQITIKDTGKGIPKNLEDSFNNEEYTITSEKSAGMDGSGLGLTITKSLVEMLEGKITVESSLNVGTTFTINLKQKIIL